MTNPTEETVADVLAEMRLQHCRTVDDPEEMDEPFYSQRDVDSYAEGIAAALARERKALLEVASEIAAYEAPSQKLYREANEIWAARLRAIAGEKP